MIKCDKFNDSNIFNLYILKNSNKIFCKSDIQKEEKKNIIKYVGENNQISFDILSESTSEEDLKKLTEANANEINKRENLIEELSYVANRFLNKV